MSNSTPCLQAYLIVIAALALFPGCQQPTGYSRTMFSRMPYNSTRSREIVALPKDYPCPQPDGVVITLPAGDYQAFGAEANGVFWRSLQGIRLSTSGDALQSGGVYRPKDPAKRCVLWLSRGENLPSALPQASSQQFITSVAYVGDVPAAFSMELQTLLLRAKD